MQELDLIVGVDRFGLLKRNSIFWKDVGLIPNRIRSIRGQAEFLKLCHVTHYTCQRWCVSKSGSLVLPTCTVCYVFITRIWTMFTSILNINLVNKVAQGSVSWVYPRLPRTYIREIHAILKKIFEGPKDGPDVKQQGCLNVYLRQIQSKSYNFR